MPGTSNLDQLIEKLDQNEFDLVAIGRAFLVDPTWAAKIRDGRIDELVPFTADALNKLY